MQAVFEKCPRCGAHLEPYGPCPLCGLSRDEMPFHDDGYLERIVKEALVDYLSRGSNTAFISISKIFWLLKRRGIKLEKMKYGRKISWILNRIADEWGWGVEKKIRGTKKVYLATLPPSLSRDR